MMYNLTLRILGNFMLLLLSSVIVFSKISFRNTIRVSNSWDPDQDRHFVGPDLGPNCLQTDFLHVHVSWKLTLCTLIRLQTAPLGMSRLIWVHIVWNIGSGFILGRRIGGFHQLLNDPP